MSFNTVSLATNPYQRVACSLEKADFQGAVKRIAIGGNSFPFNYSGFIFQDLKVYFVGPSLLLKVFTSEEYSMDHFNHEVHLIRQNYKHMLTLLKTCRTGVSVLLIQNIDTIEKDGCIMQTCPENLCLPVELRYRYIDHFIALLHVAIFSTHPTCVFDLRPHNFGIHGNRLLLTHIPRKDCAVEELEGDRIHLFIQAILNWSNENPHTLQRITDSLKNLKPAHALAQFRTQHILNHKFPITLA